MPGAYVRQEYRERSPEPVRSQLLRAATRTICEGFWGSCDLRPPRFTVQNISACDKEQLADTTSFLLGNRPLCSIVGSYWSVFRLTQGSTAARHSYADCPQ